MQSKLVLLSAILACGSASLASENKDKRSPLPIQKILAMPNLPAELRKSATNTDKRCFTISGDNCGDTLEFPACAGDTNSAECVLNSKCVITLQDCLPEAKVQARQGGGGSPFDPELFDEQRIEARQEPRISDEIQSAMPAEIRNAMLNDPNVAESLANEFSGSSVPQWYARLPASVTNYYATITPPPTMIGYAVKAPTDDPQRQSVDDWVASIQSYKNLIASLSRAASSESQSARRMSRAASEKSKWASEEMDGQLQTSAYEQSVLAASMSRDAALESSYAASASRTIYAKNVPTKQGGSASTSDTRLAFGLSIVAAVVCLGLAFAL
ncbi:uncharacterized protein Z519_03738 [Cladophialophora bantiana CBS 173.52]|uniref:Extracellular membrane protein CFEM domain-containing protein n=1 Tax=Cladophialophora bantiana (strain ATCC 10958 / CBS 173.52 / CDC B-1940 / NIH 8579) TaxID=1442370 RepID=A0A0D2IEE1_CLAB1|nr:uncharacterized protein Z519_03738 [Cladophialophora bantiana CBS 173.52]KIW95154.1 hypothetical protein Z519_03738 [Cladophialophora bantiana CBS 173.52]